MSTTPGQRLLYLAPQPSTARAYAVRLEANPTGTHLMYANGRSIVVRELANPDHAQVYSGHTKQVTVARFAPTGNYVASGDVRGNVRIWDFADSEHRVKYEAQGLISGGVSEISGIRDIAWDAESKRVLAVGDGRETLGHVFMWDSGNSTGTISGHTRTVNACSMRPKRPFRAATASDDQTVCFYSGAPYKHELTIRDHAGFVNDVRFSPDGALFASVGQDKCIFVYDGDTGDRAVDLASAAASAAGSGSEAKHKGTIFSLAWSPDSTQLITSSADSTVRLWDVAAQKLISTFTIHPDVRRPGFTRFDTQQVGNLWTPSHMVSLSSDGTLNYLDPRDHNGRPARAVTGLQKPIVASAYSVKETTLFAGSNDGRVAAWDIGSALREEGEGEGGSGHLVLGETHASSLTDIAVDNSSAQAVAITGGFDDSLRAIDASIDVPAFASSAVALGARPSLVASLAGGRFAVVDTTGVLSIVEGKQIRTAASRALERAKKSSPTALAATADGMSIAVGYSSGTIDIHCADTLAVRSTLPARPNAVSRLAYSPSGNYLAVGEAQGRIAVLDAAAGAVKFSQFTYHTGRITALDWSANGTLLASGSLDTNIYVWNTEQPGKKYVVKNAHSDGVAGIHFHSVVDGDHIVVVSAGADAAVVVSKFKWAK